ncbi:DUF6493 family protein [Capnocytophaga gingivalis]|uniref:DUF6493 family protein n=1 Tax=Capnocytophaga gingivalis TaxID=1017 RepID=UPI002B49BFE6|nr:DUF6493 family protein [Capnocytophaga gingivalis]MEB3013119.1 DUF6493 family protein [Capnocytophaga gingivalis]
MFEHLKKLITTHDLDTLFSFCSNLADNERLALLEEFQQSKWGLKESFWDKGMFELQPPNNSDYEFIIALFLLTRSVEEYQALSIHEICGYYVASSRFFSNSKALHILPKILQEEKYRFILDLYHSVKPEDREFIAFETYWALYKAGEIPFDEALFTKNITATYLYDDKKVRYTDLVLHDQEFHDKIFRRLHCYENQMFHDAKPWEDFFVHLQRQGYVFDRKYIPELLESLLNPWKKPHLNWHCRWVEFLEPTTDELLACQQTLFALLSTGNTNLINFALKHIQRIANEKDFDFQSFADNFALCFATPKIAKSQLIGLNILEKHYKQQAPTHPEYREQLAVLFTVPDAKLQEKVANLLTTYFNHEGLPEVIAPYRDYLKGKAQDLLATLSPSESSAPSDSSDLSDGSASSENSHTSHTSQTARMAGTLTPVSCPLTPEKLLFLLGDCLRERTPQTIDLFFEGFNQLQDDFPADFKEQLAPYLKQLERHWNGIASVPILRWFLQRWTGDKKKLSKEDEEFFLTTLPYLYHKAQHLLKNRKKQNKLPFLSTPTHAPFYIEAEVLMDRLLQYEAQGENPDLHDLVVACNRLLFKDISAVAKEKAQQLKGVYAPAIQYYIGLTDKVQPTKELLPLWTQITRIKHPNKEFPIFENTTAKDIPCVVKPFETGFGVLTRKQSTVTFHYLSIHDNWNNNFDARKKPTEYPVLYYNAGNSRKGWSTDILYQCSLNPHYPEAQILRYIASYAKGNESYDIEYMQTSMQVLLENHLPIYHSGWLFVAAALLFEKKPTRDMAAAYILECLESGTNLNLLAQYIGKLLAEQYAPIARFVEFLDIPTRDPKVKAFQKSVVEAYLPLAEKLDKKPTNHKKLATFIN